MGYLINDVNELLNHDCGEIINSPLVMKLLTVYSQLYLNGRPPKLCGKCHEKYYNQLKINGMEKAELLEKAKNRTCEPFWNGNKYIPKMARHYSNLYITDKEAIRLLNEGHLKENDFTKLPDGYKKIEDKIKDREENEVKENPVKKTYPKKAGRPKKSQ